MIIDSKNKKIYGNKYIQVPNPYLSCFFNTGDNEAGCPEKIWEPNGEIIKYDLEI